MPDIIIFLCGNKTPLKYPDVKIINYFPRGVPRCWNIMKFKSVVKKSKWKSDRRKPPDVKTIKKFPRGVPRCNPVINSERRQKSGNGKVPGGCYIQKCEKKTLRSGIPRC